MSAAKRQPHFTYGCLLPSGILLAVLFTHAVTNDCRKVPMQQHILSTEHAVPSAPTRVLVTVMDGTETRPIPENAELWFRGNGSWFIEDASNFPKTMSRFLGPRDAGATYRGDDAIELYPDGRDGQKINIPLLLQPEDHPKDYLRNSILIDIRDNDIEIIGSPLLGPLNTGAFRVPR